MTFPPPRLLYLPNEPVPGWQSGPRRAFEKMREEGDLSDYRAISFEHLAQTQSHDAVREEIASACRDFRPDIVLWQHVSGFEVTESFLNDLKRTDSRPCLVYHEADVFGRLIKRPTRSMRLLAAAADIVFTVGTGWWADRLRGLGASDVRYAPHYYDEDMFGTAWEPTAEREFDIVMIANLVESRFRMLGLGLPGTRERRALAIELDRRHGSRFALYGRGWDDYPFARGPIEFDRQVDVVRRGWISVIWNHFPDVPDYFSDRLPISFASGVAHASNAHPGYGKLFRNGETLIYEDSVAALADRLDAELKRPGQELIDIGEAGKRYAADNLTAYKVLRSMVADVTRTRFQRTE